MSLGLHLASLRREGAKGHLAAAATGPPSPAGTGPAPEGHSF